MISGTKYRGDFEKRLKGVLGELKSLDDSILFIDEIHTLLEQELQPRWEYGCSQSIKTCSSQR